MSNGSFAEDARNFPVFCLVKPTEQYWYQLTQGTDLEALVQICSNAPDRGKVIEDIKNGSDKLPFLGSTPSDCYEFFKKHLRPDQNASKRGPFSSFTFIVIDATSLERDPPECLICCDAPDYGDESPGHRGSKDGDGGEAPTITLKTHYVPLTIASQIVISMEQLIMTISEIRGQHRDDKGQLTFLSCMPPFTLKPASSDPSRDEVCTPAEARAHKQRALACERPSALQIYVGDRERRRTYFIVPYRESLRAATLFAQVETLASRSGALISHNDNRTEESKEKMKREKKCTIM